MSKLTSTRLRTACLTLSLLILGLAVFSWGLEYKLSLYQQPGSEMRLMPEAKLLASQDKQDLKAGGQLSAAPAPHDSAPGGMLLGLFLAAALWTAVLALVPLQYLRLHAPLPLCLRTLAEVPFVRPPPALRALL